MAPRLHPFALAFATGLLVSLVFLVAHLGPGVMGLSVPSSPLLALLLVAAKPLLDILSRRTADSRGPVATSLALALVAPWITVAALHALGEPVAYSGHGRCGTPRAMDEMAAPVAFFLAGALGMLVGLVLVRRQGRVDRVAPALGGALAALALVALAASLARTSHRPDPDHYAESLPVVASVRAADPRDLVGWVDPPGSKGVHPLVRYETDLGGPILSRLCDGQRCIFVGLRSPSVPPQELGAHDWDAAHDQLAYWDDYEGKTLVVRRDRDHDVWILESPWGSAYRGPTFRRSDIAVSDVTSALRPPGGWMAGTAGGLVLAGLIFALRRRALRAAADLAAGRPGTLGESGMVTFAGGEPPVRAAPAQLLAVGPVVVLPGPVTPGGVYRGDASLQGARVVCGAKDELYAAARDRASALGALLPAVVLLGAAPLLAAALAGIVF